MSAFCLLTSLASPASIADVLPAPRFGAEPQNLSGRTIMLKVTLTLDAQQKLASLLAKDEDFDQPYLRIRSVVAGGG